MKNLRYEIESNFDIIDYGVYCDYTDQDLENTFITDPMRKRGKQVAVFVEEKIAKSFCEFYNHQYSSRPIKEHEYLKGDWKAENVTTHNGDFYKVKCNDTSVCNITTRNSKHASANSRLIEQAPNLHQIAEQYFDHLHSSGKKDTMIYQIILKTLNEI